MNNVVIFFRYEKISHFSEKCGTFFSYGDRLLNHFNYCMQWNLTPTKTSSHFSEQCGTFFSYGDINHFSEQCGTFFSYGDRLINPFNYCSSLVPFNTIYSIDILSLCSAADKDEWDRRKYGILLYFTLRIFIRYRYQKLWYQYRVNIRIGK